MLLKERICSLFLKDQKKMYLVQVLEKNCPVMPNILASFFLPSYLPCNRDGKQTEKKYRFHDFESWVAVSMSI